MEEKSSPELIAEGLEALNLDFSPEKVDLIQSYLQLLLEENRRHNLIGAEGERTVIVDHFFDCLAPLQLEDISLTGPVMDLGTGGGLPGLLWAIMLPDIDIYLLDSRRKKVDFLRRVVKRLKLENCYPLQERAEALGGDEDFREKFSLVTARAVASTSVLLEYALPLVRIGGSAGLFKGPSYPEELEDGERASELLGGGSIEVRELNVPRLRAERYFLLVQKCRETPGRFPRRTGVPEKRPL